MRWIAVAVVLVPALGALATLAWGELSRSETLGPVRGVRLGTTLTSARDRLQTGQPGDFRTSAIEEDVALDWTPAGDSSEGELRSARLEFHLGLLVAMRLRLAPDAPEASGPALEVTEASVLSREPLEDGVQLTWLARSCPTHADEVQRRIGPPR